jgi:aryl-alcohol dehydrogenase-like predicted oxidoreductase
VVITDPQILQGIPRDNYTLSSKIWVSQGGIPEPERPDADIVVERFRKELNTDYLDIVQIHCMTDPQWTDKQKKQMDILENLKAKNIIRAHGVSVHSLEAMEAALNSSWVDIIHVRVNPYGDSMDKKDPSLVIPVIEKLHKSGKGVIGMKLIGNGKFRDDSDKINASLKYVLGLGFVDMIIVGFELPEQIDNYVARVENTLKAQLLS